MMTKFPSIRIAATCSKKARNGLADPRIKSAKNKVRPIVSTCWQFFAFVKRILKLICSN
jgi:hypothetical protein